MSLKSIIAVSLLASASWAQSTTETPATETEESPTAVTDCHAHGPTPYCVGPGGEEYAIVGAPTASPTPTAYIDCHPHGSTLYCFPENGGEEVQVIPEGAAVPATEEEHNHTDEESHSPSGSTSEAATGERNCHFHAGVEHCVGGSESEEAVSCERIDRDYDIPLRVGLLFVILVTSAIGVFAPLLFARWSRFNSAKTGSVLLVVKQFGTGIIISTAFIHLYTHAQLLFSSPCLGELSYEGTTAAILMAGLIISFLIDYLSHRFVHWRQRKTALASTAADPTGETHSNFSSDGIPTAEDSKHLPTTTTIHAGAGAGHNHHLTPRSSTDKVTVLSLEAGILFHSILIGLILVVAGDAYFITLFIVIIFHQMFEGLALGSVLAAVPNALMPTRQKLVGAGLFALITPLGMAIGIGVLSSYNGNDPSTIIAIGTLDAFSAGILIWVGVVEMLSKDWMEGELVNAGLIKTLASGFALVCGLVLMSVLGKWA